MVDQQHCNQVQLPGIKCLIFNLCWYQVIPKEIIFLLCLIAISLAVLLNACPSQENYDTTCSTVSLVWQL